MLEKFIQHMQDAGLYFDHKYLPANMDVVSVLFCDRCDYKTKRTYMISIAFTGLEQLQANEGFARIKADYALRDYAKAMEQFGGFKRADVCISPSAS